MDYREKKKYVKNAIKWSKKAGKIQRKRLGTDMKINTKSSPIDLVTEIDEKSEKIIKNGIHKAYPEHSILAEESGMEKNEREFRWIIDPLDGTTNYAHGLPYYSISIALEKNKEVKIGCIHAPSLKCTFTGIRNEGAWLNGEPIKVSNVTNLSKAMISSGFPYNNEDSGNPFPRKFSTVFKKGGSSRRMGSAALNLSFTSSGAFDGFVETNKNPWDVAAGILVVKEAGGKVTDFKGNEIEYNPSVVGGNKKICNKLLEEL